MIQNRKAHADPLCITFMVFALAAGGVSLANVLSARSPSMMYVIVFAALALLAAMVHIFHHGFHPIGMIFGAVILLLSIMLIRVAIGNPTPFSRFYLENLNYVIPSIMALIFLNTIA